MDAWQKRFSQQLTERLELRVADLKDKIVETRAVDFADYKERVGVITGLKMALADARELEEAMDRPDEQRREPHPTAQRHYES